MRAAHDERGFTLVEMLVVSVLTLLVLSMAFDVLSTTERTAAATSTRGVNSVEAREVLTSLEADLRFATVVSVCAASTTTSCVTPTAGSPTTLAVATQAQPTCTYWTIQSSGVAHAGVSSGLWRTISGKASLLFAGVAAAANPGGTSTAGFGLPFAGSQLVEIDLGVNAAQASAYHPADTVSVHDLIAPDEVPVAGAGRLPTGWAC